MDTKTTNLEGKTALVTGSSRGIGRAIAGHLASLGAAVAVHGTSPFSTRVFNEADSLEAVAEAIASETGSQVVTVHGDLSDEPTVKRVVAEARQKLGQIDILVNNAGGGDGAAGMGGPRAGRPEVDDCVFISSADMHAILGRNLMSCIYVCREVAPEMIERRSGRIVNFSSRAAARGMSTLGIYAVAKAGVSHYTRCLAVQLRPYNVTVNAIAPGSIVTEHWKRWFPPDDRRLVHEGTLDRYGWPIEAARLVEFFCSPLSDYVSAQVVRLDGGEDPWPA